MINKVSDIIFTCKLLITFSLGRFVVRFTDKFVILHEVEFVSRV